MMGSGAMLFGVLLMFLFWGGLLVLLGLGAWALIRSGQRRGERGAAPGSRAMEILQERYARGEISREEYEERRRDLES